MNLLPAFVSQLLHYLVLFFLISDMPIKS